MLTVSQTYFHNFKFSQADVISFANVTGDKNPVHLDEVFAAKIIFKRRIMRGMLSASIFSKVFSNLFPSEGTIYRKHFIIRKFLIMI
jgi:3-hydroxybutyryl-CoA dehydratase